MPQSAASNEVSALSELVRSRLGEFAAELVDLGNTGILREGLVREHARKLTAVPSDRRLLLVIETVKNECVAHVASAGSS